MYPSTHFLLSLRWTIPCTRPLDTWSCPSEVYCLTGKVTQCQLSRGITSEYLRKSLPIVSNPQHRPQVLHLMVPANTHQFHLTPLSQPTATAHQPLDFFLFSEQTKLLLGSEPGLRLNPSPSLVETFFFFDCARYSLQQESSVMVAHRLLQLWHAGLVVPASPGMWDLSSLTRHGTLTPALKG